MYETAKSIVNFFGSERPKVKNDILVGSTLVLLVEQFFKFQTDDIYKFLGSNVRKSGPVRKHDGQIEIVIPLDQVHARKTLGGHLDETGLEKTGRLLQHLNVGNEKQRDLTSLIVNKTREYDKPIPEWKKETTNGITAPIIKDGARIDFNIADGLSIVVEQDPNSINGVRSWCALSPGLFELIVHMLGLRKETSQVVSTANQLQSASIVSNRDRI